MHHPARTIRGIAEDLPEARPFLEKRDRQRHDLIRAVGRRAFAELGPGSFSLKDFAKAVWMSVNRFTQYYCDLESLLAELIETHLFELYEAVGDIPSGSPDRPAAHRAAYVAATRNYRGGLTQSHLLLLHARRSLPPDLRDPIEKLRNRLGEVMAPGYAEAAFRFLDAPDLSLTEIEATLATFIATREAQLQLPLRHPVPANDAAPKESVAAAEQEQEEVEEDEEERSAGLGSPPPAARQATPLSDLLRLTRSMADIGNRDWPASPTRPPPRRRDLDRPPDPEPAHACQATTKPP